MKQNQQQIKSLIEALALSGYTVIVVYDCGEPERYFASRNYTSPNGVGVKTLKFVGKEISPLMETNALAINYIDETQRKIAIDSAIEKYTQLTFEFSEKIFFEIITSN